MKNLLPLLILICTTKSYAFCGAFGLTIFPSSNTVRQNPVFILNGYSGSQKVILGLNKKHNVYLKSGKKKVKLEVIEICVGDFELTQAVLKPETELEAGHKYTMYIDNLSEYEVFNKYNYTTNQYELVTYQVVAGRDLESPQVNSKPKELEKTLVYYGCGPATFVHFSNPCDDSTEIIVRTTVKNLTTGNVTTYYIEPEEGKILIGHGMCGGGFKFEQGNNFEVSFSFMDASGNMTHCIGKPIKFTKPIESTDPRDK